MNKEINFEEAQKELEEILKKLEDEKTPFSQAQVLYQKGSELVKICLEKLDNLKGSVTIIKKDLDKYVEEKFE